MSGFDADLLRGLSAEEAREVLALARPRSCSMGETIFHLGDEATEMSLVEEGRVNLTMPILMGGRSQDLMVEERVEGQLLGWSALIPPSRFKLTGRAAEDTKLHVFSSAALLGFLTARPEVGSHVMSNLARIIGQRLEVFQTMWIREMQHRVQSSLPDQPGGSVETST